MGADSKQIRNRIRSVDSTLHITKAMQLVASSKVRRAQEAAKGASSYAAALQDAFAGLLSGSGSSSELVSPKAVDRDCYILIAGDRGLAGGYNNNILRLFNRIKKERDYVVFPIGKRAVDFCEGHREPLLGGGIPSAEKITDEEAASLSAAVLKGYRAGEFDRVVFIMTRYVNVLSQVADTRTVLPLTLKEEKKRGGYVMFEPDAETVLNTAIPIYLTAQIYGAVRESCLSEQYARRNAMDSASKNATDMIERLNLSYNRARQSAITQEITEIVAGAEGQN